MHPSRWALAVLVTMGSFPGTAAAARLLDDTPATTLTQAALASSLVVTEAPVAIGFGEHFGKTAAGGVFASTAGVLIAVPFGALSNELIWAALPALLSHLFIGPALTVLTAWLLGNLDSPGRYGFWGAFGTTVLVHAAVFALASLLMTVPWTNPVALLLYTLVDGLLMSGASVGFMHLFPTTPKAAPTLTSFVPGVSDTAFVPCSTVAF